MTLQIDLPDELETHLRHELSNIDRTAKMLLLIEAFRLGKLTHYQLSQGLGLDRFETDALLKEHNVFEGSPTLEDFESDRLTLERLLGPA